MSDSHQCHTIDRVMMRFITALFEAAVEKELDERIAHAMGFLEAYTTGVGVRDPHRCFVRFVLAFMQSAVTEDLEPLVESEVDWKHIVAVVKACKERKISVVIRRSESLDPSKEYDLHLDYHRHMDGKIVFSAALSVETKIQGMLSLTDKRNTELRQELMCSRISCDNLRKLVHAGRKREEMMQAKANAVLKDLRLANERNNEVEAIRRKEVETQTRKLNKLHNRLNEDEIRLKSLQTEIKDMEANIGVAQEIRDKFKQTIQNLDREKDDLEKHKMSLESDIRVLKNKNIGHLQIIEAEKQALASRSSALSRVKDMDAEIQELEARCMELQDMKADQVARKKRHEALVEFEREKATTLEAELSCLAAKVACIKSQIQYLNNVNNVYCF
ncbi:hypothetical protein CEUSTIGMA_g12686.t1 [Chlamydomonas eustigma]|uniref:Uncharacterized protein n=1 Tax=Chlamydomonas eustigma TaxID=1157962 RepID=A0A250XQB7_9CHLO|nr:hypothetical protein CEUSTIGMA_g12686.t1 [Chlamydomonas eustigma]|eukprot:GAX85267.1 hypothetical protein CEUSTIGMA_g12686.t1 [Chlamydomonas eustigma]